LWFPEWEFGGRPWDPKARAQFARWSPHLYAHNIKTPTLIITNELDYRVPVDQGLQMFTVLRRNVHGQEHRLLKLDDPGASPRYVWLVFVTLFGSTPETSSKGPTVLASGLDWTDKITNIVKPYATVAAFSEIKLDEIASVG